VVEVFLLGEYGDYCGPESSFREGGIAFFSRLRSCEIQGTDLPDHGAISEHASKMDYHFGSNHGLSLGKEGFFRNSFSLKPSILYHKLYME
jgi:hypothetical protein